MPTIVFQVNLTTVDSLTTKLPVAPTDSASNFPSTRSTWWPSAFGSMHKMKHADLITLSGQTAVYALNNFTSGEFKFLDVVTNTPG